MTVDSNDLIIPTLGPCTIPSPVPILLGKKDCRIGVLGDEEKIVFDPRVSSVKRGLASDQELPSLELAGPQCKIFFEPQKTTAAIVTCGGLCPGINDVIREIVMTLHYRYEVTKIYGIRYGYQGLVESYGHPMIPLTPESVDDIHTQGGTILSSSRGNQDSSVIVDFLEKNGIDILFTIGGDGTLRGALAISKEARRRNLKISVVGIPKTVDNDILYIDESFGFETAFSEAVKSISSAHTESKGAPNGIGLVRLMGRHSGFIACHAALAMNDVNYVLIPEVPFQLQGQRGLLNVLKDRLARKKHAVIVVAEGAGQELMEAHDCVRDASGNIRLKDIGIYLREQIKRYFEEQKIEVNLKYIDPSYIIRSIPASAPDSVYCLRLAAGAVHAAMSGRTEMVVGRRHGFYVHLPMKLIATGRKQVNPDGDLWFSVLEATGQPVSLCD